MPISSLKTCSFITRSLKSLRHPPTLYRNFTSLAENPASIPKFDPHTTWNVKVPYDHAIGIERDGRYLETLYQGNHSLVPNLDRIIFEYPLYPCLMIKVSTPEEETGLAMELNLVAKIDNPLLAFEKFGASTLENYYMKLKPINWEKVVEVQEAIERVISKMLLDDNIPHFFRKKNYKRKSYKFIFEEELKRLGVFDEINKVVTPVYGLKCERFRFKENNLVSCSMSPALCGRLFGAAADVAWRKFIGLEIDEDRRYSKWTDEEDM